MPAITDLTTGCMEMIMTGGDCEKPVLQILGTKKISGGENERYRLLVSDGKYLNSFAMLATQLNDLYKEGNLVEYTIIRVDRYITSMVNKSDKVDKRVLIILELTVMNHGAEVGKKIGNPVQFTGEASKPAAASAPAVAPKLEKESTYGSKTTNGNSYSSSTSNTINYNNNTSMNQSINPSTTAPISSLTPYQNKWVIKARVTAKSGIRTWNNAKGEGKLFSMDLLDESGEIRATAFKEQCDRYYDMLEVDKVYYFSKCQLKPANKQYSTLKNDYEMTFTGETLVQPCEDESDGIPQVQYNLVPISQIASIEPKAAVDTIGICRDVGELQTFTSRANKEFKKRELTLVDLSNAAVQLTLWGDEAEKFESGSQHVILIKGARVSEFGGGKSLSMGAGSVMKINPDIPEGHRLRGWFDNGGGANISNSVSTRTGGGSYNTDWISFYEARTKNLGTGEKPDYFQCKAVVRLIRSANSTYKACPQPDCNKKVIDENNGHYRCEKCNAMFPNFKYRLLVNMEIGDWTSSRWVTCFSDLGEQLLGKTSQEIGEALENDPQEAEQIFSSINFHEFVFKLRSKVETYGDTPRNKLTAVAATPINYKEYNKYLINSLKELTGIGKNQ
ncbi:replication protein A 70 kDa DNA-binding subunit [Eupeodes corollae]|uniref:replication protein A 70 kDa DNA-binding subunit n=1 Tax=Eupeodes corollae TaxID=290404 RepID=UPI0024924F05|nr:replication protein A 70 kDa DNA-binding subunit [Eupeodes corollae]